MLDSLWTRPRKTSEDPREDRVSATPVAVGQPEPARAAREPAARGAVSRRCSPRATS